MEAMLGDQLAEAEAEDGIGPLLSEEEAAEEAAVAAKLEEAMALNAQLKAMMIQAEEAELQERMRQQPRGGTRGGMPRGTAAPGSGPRMPGTPGDNPGTPGAIRPGNPKSEEYRGRTTPFLCTEEVRTPKGKA